MATTIDIENAKQIRQPMDVVIEMNVPDTSVTLTYSGYFTTSKISDGELDEPTWPMRGLADLQGQGFPLDGSRELYDSGVTPSEANGKIGVRGNIGQSVNVTVRGNKTIASLFVHATGAESITFGSTTTPIINDVVTIPVGATSITLTLNPASATERIEISEIGAGARFSITNENLIKATVSLRSDLSIINPTLPESELNIEVYQDTDIAEVVAAIPEDTPITYSAGYEGDMSPTRKFYVTGQVTWADNVLSIQAVDAVHLLDIENLPVTDVLPSMDTYSIYVEEAVKSIIGSVDADGTALFNRYSTTDSSGIIFPAGVTVREIIASLMNLLRWPIVNSQHFRRDNYSRYVMDYVDAGIPRLRVTSAPPMWSLREEDCGDVEKSIERKKTVINYSYSTVKGYDSAPILDHLPYVRQVGSAKWIKNVGVSVELDDYVNAYAVGVPEAYINNFGADAFYYVAAASRNGEGAFWGHESIAPPSPLVGLSSWFSPMVMRDTPNGTYWNLHEKDYMLTSFVDWNIPLKYASTESLKTQAQYWNRMVSRGRIPSDATETELFVYGAKPAIDVTNGSVSTGEAGVTEQIDLSVMGNGYFANRSGTVQSEAYPRSAMNQLLKRSNKTGSFKWKGDPRMQPRDNATITMRDGTEKVITLENITLTHERGGLSAEITYREGAV